MKRKINVKTLGFIESYASSMEEALKFLDKPALNKLIELIWDTYKTGGTIYFAGNGGSASTASHMASDIGKNTVLDYRNQEEKRFKTLSLCDNVSWITALGNDISYDDIFSEQLKNFGKSNDLLVVVSGSGNSINIVKLVIVAKKMNIMTAGILGFDGGIVKGLVDHSLIVKSNDYGIVESIHSCIQHFIVEGLKLKKREEKK